MKSSASATLDARGLNCPLPILRTKKELAKLSQGETLQVQASDPGSVKDMSAFCLQTGHELITSENNEDGFLFIVRKTS